MWTSCGGIFDIAGKDSLAALDTEMGSPTFWEDSRRAQELTRERSELSRAVSGSRSWRPRPKSSSHAELAAEADDGSLDAEITEGVAKLRRDLDEFELR